MPPYLMDVSAKTDFHQGFCELQMALLKVGCEDDCS